MVAVEEIEEGPSMDPSPSKERLWDAEEIENLLPQVKRPTAKMQLESLVKKIRKEASALKALESTNDSGITNVAETTTARTAVPSAAPKPNQGPPINSPSAMYNSIDRFAFDAGGHSDKFVTLYIPLAGVGSIEKKKEQIKCDFGKDKFDLIVNDFNGKNYRLMRDNLEHDIVPEKSKYIVKADKIVVKLHKAKGEYGSFDYWSKLTDPKRKDKKKSTEDPTAGLMGMMKEMYDSGDDNMRKMIGETMLKQRNGELNKDKPGDFGDL